MAKIKFMPIENPIDKLYSDMTGLPFPVSAAIEESESETVQESTDPVTESTDPEV